MSKQPEIKKTYFSRKDQSYHQEEVFKEGYMNFLFDTKIGNFLTKIIFSKKFFSKFYGSYYDTPKSTSKIPPFIKDHNIDMNQFFDNDFKSFNDFFVRNFKSNERVPAKDPQKLAAICEGRYLGFPKISEDMVFPVKGKYFKINDLMESNKWKSCFSGGPLLICRLAPQDYHRYHYPDNGKLLESYDLAGDLFSVNPLSLKNFPQTFIRNQRRISVLQTQNFGKILYIEVGAFCVGRIIQTNLEPTFNKGQEKGYFLFGGSTVILIGEPEKWTISKDIIEQTSKKTETLIQLGDEIGFI